MQAAAYLNAVFILYKMSNIVWFNINLFQALIISHLINDTHNPAYKIIGFISSCLFVYSGYVGFYDIEEGIEIQILASSVLASLIICPKFDYENN